MSSKARYLLRFDDLCPTMSRGGWLRFHALICRHRLKPILGIVPDNQDIDLLLEPPHEEFWQWMRELACGGASVGLHGLHHLNSHLGKSLIPLHQHTEFAGAALIEQISKIQRGMGVLRSYGLDPNIWVAPRHGFDRNTLQALLKVGLTRLSDGLASRPFLQEGIVWLPQQLWAPVRKGTGLWTLCIHSNTCTDHQFSTIAKFIEGHRQQFIGVEEALRLFPPTPLRPMEAALAQARLARIRFSRWRNGRFKLAHPHL